MFPLFRSLTVRYLLQKWDRAALVALSISLGVATLVSARLLNQCVEAAALDSTVPADVADLYVDNGEAGVDRSIVTEIRSARVNGVARVEPFVVVRVILPELGGRSAVVFGSDLSTRTASDAQAADKLKLSLTWVRNPLTISAPPVALGRRLYDERKRRGRSDTDPIEVRYTNVTEKFDLVAVIDVARDSPIAPFADSLLAMDVSQAARLTRRPGPILPGATASPAWTCS